MTDWASIASEVASIGVGLLTSLLGEASDHAPQYTQGDIVWSLDKTSNTIYAHNKGQHEHGLSLAMSHTAPHGCLASTTYYHAISAGKSAQVDLLAFPAGRACIGKSAEVPDASQAAADATATVSFSMPFLALATPVKIMQGLHLTINQEQKGGLYQVSLQSDKDGPHIKSAHTTVTDLSGSSVSASTKFKSASADNTYTFDLPKGVNLNPVVGNVNLEITMDNASYLRATEESRRKLVQGPPQGLHLAGARS